MVLRRFFPFGEISLQSAGETPKSSTECTKGIMVWAFSRQELSSMNCGMSGAEFSTRKASGLWY
jgi:hypothetical protein